MLLQMSYGSKLDRGLAIGRATANNCTSNLWSEGVKTLTSICSQDEKLELFAAGRMKTTCKDITMGNLVWWSEYWPISLWRLSI